MSPLPAPIVPKSNVLSHPERRILRVRRPSARQKASMYQKDEVDELADRMNFLDIGSNVPKKMKAGNSPWNVFQDGGQRKRRFV